MRKKGRVFAMDYSAVIAFFDEYNDHFRSFLKFEYSKLDMIHKGEIEKLTQALSSEQAFIMKSNSLENKRIKMLGEEKTFADIIEEAPEKYRSTLNEQYKALSEMVYKIKEINDTANIIISERLKKISTGSRLNDSTYDGHGTLQKDFAAGSKVITDA